MLNALIKDFDQINPFNKKTNPHFPIKEIIEAEHVVKTIDNKYKSILKIIDPLNTDLMDVDDLMQAINIAEETINYSTGAIQFLISSEVQNIEQHLDKIDHVKKLADDKDQLDNIIDIEDFVIKRTMRMKNVHQFYYVITSQFTNEKNAIKELNELSKEVIRNLERSDIHAIRLNYDEIREVYYNKLNPKQSIEQPYNPGMSMREVLPYNVPDKDTYFILDGMYCQTFALQSIPKSVSPKWLSRVINADENIDISINMIPTEEGRIKKDIERRINRLEGLDTKSIVAKRENEKKINDQLSMLDQLIKKNTKVFETLIVITLKANTLEDLLESAKRLRQSLDSVSFKLKSINKEAISNVSFMIPIAYTRDFVVQSLAFPLLSRTIAGLLCFDSSTFYYPKGALFGFINEVHPVIYDQFDNTVFSNPNETVLGVSGSGKSFYLKVKIRREKAYRIVDKHIIIDPEGEFKFPEATRIIFRVGSKHITNIFHVHSAIIDNDDEDDLGKEDVGAYLDYKITETLSFFKWICPELTNREMGKLQEAIKKIYKDVSGYTNESKVLPDVFPTLSDLYNLITTDEKYMTKLEMLADSLASFVGEGAFASMFDGQTNWNFNDDMLVLVTKGLNEMVQSALMDILTKAIWEEIKINPTIYLKKLERVRRIGLYIDEVHLMANKNNIQSLTFVNQIVKRIRKYKGKITTATQNIQDLLDAGAMGEAIINNSFTHTYLSMSELDITNMSKFLTFTSAEKKMLMQKKTFGNCIHKIGNRKFKMQIIPTEYEMSIFDKKSKVS